MATKSLPAKGKLETDVILVVKGAGEQLEDEHLNHFIRGFWSAVKSLDENAAMDQVTDELPDYKPSPHNQDGNTHKHLTEIRARLPDPDDKTRKKPKYPYKRIWIKESYWEPEALPSSALGNLSREWRMSSFVFANMFQDVFFTPNTKELRDLRQSGEPDEFRPGFAPGTRPRDYIGNYFSYLFLFLLVLLPFLPTIASLPFAMTLTSGIWLNGILLGSAVAAACVFVPAAVGSIKMYAQSGENILKNLGGAGVLHIVLIILLTYLGFTAIPSSASMLNALLLVIAAAAIWALAPTLETRRLTDARYKGDVLKSLPGLPGWILTALIFLLLSNLMGYIRVVLLLLALQVALILSRSLLWKYRKYANSDMDIATYYSYKEQTIGGNKKRIGKVDEPWQTRFPLSPWLYRYFIFLTLPIAFVGTILVRFLKWTRILSGVGETLDKFLHTALVGYMDDVVNYAMDPAQSHRVRSVIKDDIIYFHNRPGVQRIHVIAHSQGTPITYETLFHFLEKEHQKKIYTYVTIGSVLSFYNQARGILDEIYYERFPVSSAKIQNFHPEFKWINFWNFTDPITEFYGLDEYTWFREAPPIDKAFDRGRTSPTNIRSHSSLLKNHGEYWGNIGRINLPFAKRVLGEPRPKEWNPEPISPKDRHHVAVLLLSLGWLLIFAGLGVGVDWLATSGNLKFISDYFTAIQSSGQSIFQALFPSQQGAEPGLLKQIADPHTIESIKSLGQKILDGFLMILIAWVVVDWVGQFRRALNVGRK